MAITITESRQILQYVKLIEAEWHIYVLVTYATIASDNGSSPVRCQAIIWTNAGILLIGPFGMNLSEILSKIHTFSLKKMHLKISSVKWQLFCLSLNMLKVQFKFNNNRLLSEPTSFKSSIIYVSVTIC